VSGGWELFNDLWRFHEQQLAPERVSSFDFAELVICLLFLKIDDERAQRPFNKVQVVPEGLGWQSLVNKTGSALEGQFRHVVQECGKLDPDPQTLIRQAIFRSAAPELRCAPARLSSLMKDVVAATTWSDQSHAGLREMYALLMGKASAGFRIASGQTLTPLPFASAVIACLQPTSSDTVLDPACGTGSLLVAAHESMAQDQTRLESGALTGVDFDASMCRFATMNYLLSTGLPFNSPPPVKAGNSIAANEKGAPTIVVCNPPFRSTAPLPEGRTDLWVRSPSMQLNFLQHIARALPIGGRAAVFVPDNILFGGGPERTVRLRLLQEYDVHTLLRLPTGVFARGDVKVNVIFFDAARPRADGAPATDQVWIYDFRSGLHFAATQNPLLRVDLEDFVECFDHGRPRTERRATDRFKAVSYEQLAGRNFNVDILWLDDKISVEMQNPKEIAQKIVDELSVALEEFTALTEELPDDPHRVSRSEAQ
jgi:type I restriction enzyme M protein